MKKAERHTYFIPSNHNNDSFSRKKSEIQLARILRTPKELGINLRAAFSHPSCSLQYAKASDTLICKLSVFFREKICHRAFSHRCISAAFLTLFLTFSRCSNFSYSLHVLSASGQKQCFRVCPARRR